MYFISEFEEKNGPETFDLSSWKDGIMTEKGESVGGAGFGEQSRMQFLCVGFVGFVGSHVERQLGPTGDAV